MTALFGLSTASLRGGDQENERDRKTSISPILMENCKAEALNVFPKFFVLVRIRW